MVNRCSRDERSEYGRDAEAPHEQQEERLSRFVEEEPEEYMPIMDSTRAPTEESRPT